MMKAFLLSVCFLGFSVSAIAKDFGVHGDIFEIKEEHLMEMIERKLKEAEQDGRIKALQDEMVATVKRTVEEPDAVDWITPALKYRSFEYDPTVTAPENYYDNEGNVVVKAGTTVNPLDVVGLDKSLLFINGERSVETQWALDEHKKTDGAVKIIFVRGRPLDFMREHKIQVYFDQKSVLSAQFGLKVSPSKITQNKRVLLIEEIPLGVGQ